LGAAYKEPLAHLLPRSRRNPPPAAAPGADQPLAPIEDRDVGAVTLRALSWVRYDLMPAAPPPDGTGADFTVERAAMP